MSVAILAQDRGAVMAARAQSRGRPASCGAPARSRPASAPSSAREAAPAPAPRSRASSSRASSTNGKQCRFCGKILKPDQPRYRDMNAHEECGKRDRRQGYRAELDAAD